jgi:NAD(P)H dehydrogenase (quinone)
MNVLIVLAHPDPNSFNHAIADTCIKRLSENGYDVIFHDLYQEKFDPILGKTEIPKDGDVDETINRHCDELANCDGIIIVHPNWWGQPPAVLKGWIDRVLRPGLAYEFEEGDLGEGIPVGLLRAETALVFNTSNTSVHRENTVFQDPLELIWNNCIFDLCGVKTFVRRMFRIIVTSDQDQRQYWLDEVSELVDKHFPGNKIVE